LPNVSLVRFEDPEGTTQAGLSPAKFFAGTQGEGHAIVVYGRDPRGNWIILDPAFGRTLWSDETFRQRFTGDAISLSRK
jgi:ABC-type bacteriocin/lantibiotic exporter with double-glycine peptidase domain